MKKSIPFIAMLTLVFSGGAALAQQTKIKNTKKSANFYEMQAAYNKYFNEHATEKEIAGQENKKTQFERWQWYWEQRVDKQGNFPAPAIIYNEWKKYVESHSSQLAKTASSSGNWVGLGPSTSPGGYEGLGRVNCFAFDPVNANTIWVGTPAGGLWKTIDGGITWATSTDNLPVLGISSIIIDPSNTNTMYVATGDGEGAYAITDIGATSPGDTKSVGILKSTNGGATWNTTGMNWAIQNAKLIRKLIINPTNTSVLFVAASDGIYRTTDGGANWTNQRPGYFMDVLYKPGDTTTIYATSFPDTAQVFVSTDGGNNWTQTTTFGNAGRIALAVTPAAPNTVMAFACRSSENLHGIYKSTNSGASFIGLYDSTQANIMGYNYDGSDLTAGQGKYDLCLAISPTNPNIVYAGSINMWRSNNGGSSWYCVNMWSGNDANAVADTVPAIHADKHFLGFSPVNTNMLYHGCDGGAYKSDVTVTSGKVFTDITNGMVISENYRISVSQSSPKLVLSGLQDNGTKKFNGTTWTYATGGDGMECLIDYSDTTYMYATYTNGQLYLNTDGFTTSNTTTISSNIPGTPQGAWVTPYVINPLRPQTLFAGYNDVYKTTDRGTTWTAISSNIAGGSKLNSLAVAPTDSNTLYAATWASMWVTTNGGINWTDISAKVAAAITGSYKISSITVSHKNPQVVYVTSGGYSAGDKVLMSVDGGNTFTNISGTLPNVSITSIVNDKNTPGGLYIGTETGVFYRDSTLTDWIAYNTGLPNVTIGELEIQYSASRLVAGTYGRGLWATDLYTALGVKQQDKKVISDFSVNPNPTNGAFTLNIKAFTNSDRVYIYNYLGETMKELPVNNATQSIDIHELPQGIYYVAIKSNNFKNLAKLVKIN